MTEEQERAARGLFRAAKQNCTGASRRFFLHDLYDRLRATPLYLHWSHLLAAMRRFRAVALTLRILTFLFAALQTGTLVLLSATLLLLVLPLLLLSALGVLFSAALASRRANRCLSRELADRCVYVIFPPSLNSRFLHLHVTDLRQRGYSVNVVSPYLFSTTGLFKKGFYTTVRREDHSIFLVRRYYFFSLKRKVLAKRSIILQY